MIALRHYLASGIRPDDLPDTAPLFDTLRSGEWKAGTKQWLSELVERHVRSVTGVPDIRSHDLRHVGSRLDLNSGMPENELQAKLGHASPITTQRYSGRLMDRSGGKAPRRSLPNGTCKPSAAPTSSPPFMPDPSTFTLKPKHTSVRSNRSGVCFFVCIRPHNYKKSARLVRALHVKGLRPALRRHQVRF